VRPAEGIYRNRYIRRKTEYSAENVAGRTYVRVVAGSDENN
jgi:hypothetical protein